MTVVEVHRKYRKEYLGLVDARSMMISSDRYRRSNGRQPTYTKEIEMCTEKIEDLLVEREHEFKKAQEEEARRKGVNTQKLFPGQVK